MQATLLSLGLILSALTPSTERIDIEIFTTRDQMVDTPVPWNTFQEAGYRIIIFYLDDFDNITAALNQGLPANPHAAEAHLRRKLSANGAQLRQRLKRASAGLERAVALEVNEYPAIVFNRGEAVVYGERRLHPAIAAYKRYKEAKP